MDPNPNKSYELKASGLVSASLAVRGTVDPRTLSLHYPPLAEGINIQDVLRKASRTPSLPVMVEFPKEWRSVDRLNWYRLNGFTDQGAPTGEMKNQIKQAYISFGWTTSQNYLVNPSRLKGRETTGTETYIPLIFAQGTTPVKQDPRTSFATYRRPDGLEKYDNAPIDQTNSANVKWGRAHDVMLPNEEYDNYNLPNNRSIGDFISTVDHTFLKQGPYSWNPQDITVDSIIGQGVTPVIKPKLSTMAPTGMGGAGGVGQFAAPQYDIGTVSGQEKIQGIMGEKWLEDFPETSIETPHQVPKAAAFVKGQVGKQADITAYETQFNSTVAEFLSKPEAEGGLTPNGIAGIADGTVEFEFEMNENGELTKLDIYNLVDGKRPPKASVKVIQPGNKEQFTHINTEWDKFKINLLGAAGAAGAAGTAEVPGVPGTAGIVGAPTGQSTYDAIRGAGAGGAVPTGANLGIPGLGMTGTVQQQLLSKMWPSEYREALPAALPGGDIAGIRGLYKTPLELAEEAYLLSSRMGTFQPQGVIEGGKGGLGFQQYLGGQPDWRGDLQRGLAAIETVKQKIISGVSPSQLAPAELTIFNNYIGGTDTDPYAGSKNELELRKLLTEMLPAPLRASAYQNLQNIYNRQRVTRPSTVAGMPQTFMYGGSGSPFRTMAPMQVSATTPSVQPMQRVSASAPVNMNGSRATSTPYNTMITGPIDDNRVITYTKSPTGGNVATIGKEPIPQGATGTRGIGGGMMEIYDLNTGQVLKTFKITSKAVPHPSGGVQASNVTKDAWVTDPFGNIYQSEGKGATVAPFPADPEIAAAHKKLQEDKVKRQKEFEKMQAKLVKQSQEFENIGR